MRMIKTISATLSALALLTVGSSQAQTAAPPASPGRLHVDIDQGNLNPMPIAIPAFLADNPNAAQLGNDIASVVRADLDRSALFHSIDPSAYIEHIQATNIPPHFADWRVLNAQALGVGAVSPMADGRVRVEFHLWDVLGEQQLVAFQIDRTPDDWRRVAHRIADRIYEQITGEPGYFDTRIVFVSETGPKTRRAKRLMIMDQDGANPFFLTPANAMVLTPRFSPSNQLVTYLSYETGIPRVFLYDLGSNRREVLGDFPGMSYAPRFSPDSSTVAFTVDLDGNAEIYSLNLATHARLRLTNNPAIDTAPSYSPDGRQIAFESDRSGQQQIYVMSTDGSGQHRISYGNGRYATPVWSPRGDLIAFTRQNSGRFSIGVIHPDGSGERILAESYLNEAPTWSPNGRVIMFFQESAPGAGPKLWSIDLTGQNLRQVQTPTDASDPAWSPLLP
ncbi:MAG: Tol-Pal system beta propeller repeat protein TolB [Pseudomonadota bacterium]